MSDHDNQPISRHDYTKIIIQSETDLQDLPKIQANLNSKVEPDTKRQQVLSV